MTGFLFFNLGISGFWLLTDFGLLGVVVFLQSFPWFLLGGILLLGALSLWLLRRLPSVRRFRLAVTAAALFLCILLSGYALSTSPLYRNWRPPSEDGRLLRGYGAWRFHHLFHGTVVSVAEHEYVIENPDKRSFTVELTPGTRFPTGIDIRPGDALLVVGELRGDVIRAFGVRKL